MSWFLYLVMCLCTYHALMFKVHDKMHPLTPMSHYQFMVFVILAISIFWPIFAVALILKTIYEKYYV